MLQRWRVGRKELGESIIAKSFLKEFPPDIGRRKSIGRCLSFFTHCSSGMKSGQEEPSALLATAPPLLIQSISIQSKRQQLFLCNEYSLLQQSTISTSFHSGFHQRRIWSQMWLHVITTGNLLTLGCRYQRSPSPQTCAKS